MKTLPKEVFDALMATIDEPDDSPELARLAGLPHRIARRYVADVVADAVLVASDVPVSD